MVMQSYIKRNIFGYNYQTEVLSVNTQDLKYFRYCFHREDDQILILQLEFLTWNHVIFIPLRQF